MCHLPVVFTTGAHSPGPTVSPLLPPSWPALPQQVREARRLQLLLVQLRPAGELGLVLPKVTAAPTKLARKSAGRPEVNCTNESDGLGHGWTYQDEVSKLQSLEF